MTTPSQEQKIRVPNLSTDKMVDEDGYATPSEEFFRQTLVTGLQQYFGNEGVVVPSLTATEILAVQDNQFPDPQTGVPVYSCGFGRIVYNSTANSIMISVDGGGLVPLFKTVTLT